VPAHPFLIANRLLAGSYVSLQAALAFYDLIPEYVPVTTSVTTGRPVRWQTSLGLFDFHHIQVDFFDGYRLVELDGRQKAFVATPEKALLDLVYLTPGGDTIEYLRELRLFHLDLLDWSVFESLAGRIPKPKLKRAVHVLHELAEEEKGFEKL
jgi:predicted transcriptional regulator of viral defense system